MNQIQYNSYCALLRSLCQDADQHREAQSWQREVRPGDCFLQHHPQANVILYGEVLDNPPEEDQGLYDDVYARGYRFVRMWGKGQKPEGYLGAVHVSMIDHVLSREQLRRAQMCGWPCSIQVVHALLNVTKGGLA